MTTRDQALAALREQWGERWEIWVVPLALGGNTWCARRRDDPDLRHVLNAHEPNHLAEYITEAEEGSREE